MAKPIKQQRVSRKVSLIEPRSLLLISISLAAFYAYNTGMIPQTLPARALTSFDSFYPRYIAEHSNIENRRLHLVATVFSIIMGTLNPAVVISLLSAVTSGLVVSRLAPFPPLLEMAVMISTYLFVGHVILRSSKRIMLSVPLVSYGLAWIGHFLYERNKPATFEYPAFSLIGDYHMFLDCVQGKLPF